MRRVAPFAASRCLFRRNCSATLLRAFFRTYKHMKKQKKNESKSWANRVPRKHPQKVSRARDVSGSHRCFRECLHCTSTPCFSLMHCNVDYFAHFDLKLFHPPCHPTIWIHSSSASSYAYTCGKTRATMSHYIYARNRQRDAANGATRRKQWPLVVNALLRALHSQRS